VRRVRALAPHIGTRIALPDGAMLGVHEARVITDVPDDDQLHLDDGRARLGALELLRVQPPGGKPMAAADWLRGRQSR
jgi:methionyl-tRNA formyltransferase